MKKYVKFIAVLIALPLLISALPGCQAAEKVVEKPEVINISYSLRPLNMPAIVALEKKMFEEEFAKDGIKVQWHELEGPATTEALAAKSIDIATSLNYVSAIISKANGNDIKVIASYTKFPKAIGLVAATDNGVSTVADLKGKKVAVQKGTMLHEMLIRALEESGLKATDVEIVGMASTDAINAVMLKQVDAAVLPDPLLTKAIASKKVAPLRNAEGLILGQSVIAARTEFLQKYPEVAKKFLEIHKQTLEWANTNKDEALNLASEVNQMDIKAVKALYPKFDFTPGIDEANIEGFKKSAEFLKTNNFIKNDTNIENLLKDLLDTSFLNK